MKLALVVVVLLLYTVGQKNAMRGKCHPTSSEHRKDFLEKEPWVLR